jgi:hypothetical protein
MVRNDHDRGTRVNEAAVIAAESATAWAVGEATALQMELMRVRPSSIQINRRRTSMAFERHRDKNGEISRKHGNTLIRTLRKTYGAKGCADSDKLIDVLHKMDEPSLSKLVRDHEAGKLEQICSQAA